MHDSPVAKQTANFRTGWSLSFFSLCLSERPAFLKTFLKTQFFNQYIRLPLKLLCWTFPECSQRLLQKEKAALSVSVTLETALILMTAKGLYDFQVTMTLVFSMLMMVKLRHDFHAEHTLSNTSGLHVAWWDMNTALFPGSVSKKKTATAGPEILCACSEKIEQVGWILYYIFYWHIFSNTNRVCEALTE